MENQIDSYMPLKTLWVGVGGGYNHSFFSTHAVSRGWQDCIVPTKYFHNFSWG